MAKMIKIPDRWVEVVITRNNDTIKKILAGWYGGFASGDSWQLNSGVEDEFDRGDYIDFKGYSGTTYRCYKKNHGLSGITAAILANIEEELPKHGASVEVIQRDFTDTKEVKL